MAGKAAALIEPARLAELLAGATPSNRAERRALKEAATLNSSAAATPAPAAESHAGPPVAKATPAPVIGKAAALLDAARLAELLAGAAPKSRGERRALAEEQNDGPPPAASSGPAVGAAPAQATDAATAAAPTGGAPT